MFGPASVPKCALRLSKGASVLTYAPSLAIIPTPVTLPPPVLGSSNSAGWALHSPSSASY